MAKIDFPVAILDGQEFTASTGVVYTYVGTPPNGYWSAEVNGGGGGGVTQDLQSVTDEGNTTTNGATFGGDLTINSLTVGRGAGNNALNTALGSSALVANSTGSVNTAVGGNALLSNDTGERNTGIGYNALRSCTTATNNTAVGTSALFAATEGSEQGNTAVGDQSSNRITTGSRNVTMGYQSLFSAETGSKNVAIGDGAGYFIEGSNNTILGAYRGPSGQTALSDTVIISAGANEKLRIDSTGSLLFGGTLPAAPKIQLNSDGSAQFAGTVSSKSYFVSDRDAAGKSLYSGSVNGVENLNIIADGSIYAGNIAGSGTAGPGNINIQLNASSGSAEFGGRGRFGNTSTGYAGPAVSGYANTSTTNSGGIQIKNFGTGANFSSFNASGNNTAYIMADGSATFAGNVQVGGASYGNENGLVIEKTGGIRVTNNTGSYHLFRGYTRDNPANTTSITAEGLGQFKKIQLPADVTIPRIALDGSDGTATFSPGTGDFVIGEDGFIRSSRLGQYCWMNADINSIGAVAFGTAPVNDAANPSFYVKLDGSASYASGDLTITKAGRLNSTEVNTYGTAGFIANGTNNTSLDWAWRGSFGGANTSSIDYNGNAEFAGTVTATVVPPSDARFKENITPAKSQLADVVALGGLLKNYDWNDDAPLNEELRSQRQLGLVAQEAAEVCPSIVKDIYRTKTVEVTPAVTGPKGRVLTEAVTQEIDDSYKGISQDALIMKLIGAVSEQQALIKVLTQRLDDVGV